MTLKTRVARIERQVGPKEKPLMILLQDLDNPNLFRDSNGRKYQRGNGNWPAGSVNLILIVYENDWRKSGTKGVLAV